MAAGTPARLSPAEGRRFGLLVGVAFLVLGGLLLRRGHAAAATGAAGLGAALVLGGLAVPGRLGPVYRGWMKLAEVLSRVTTPIFMGLLYFLLLTPAGLLGRLAGHRPLSPPAGSSTCWRRRAEGERRGAMNHQF